MRVHLLKARFILACIYLSVPGYKCFEKTSIQPKKEILSGLQGKKQKQQKKSTL
jgi:hypothetical protein